LTNFKHPKSLFKLKNLFVLQTLDTEWHEQSRQLEKTQEQKPQENIWLTKLQKNLLLLKEESKSLIVLDQVLLHSEKSESTKRALNY